MDERSNACIKYHLASTTTNYHGISGFPAEIAQKEANECELCARL
jgi:hypothetical protein